MAHRVTFFPGNIAVEVKDDETVLDAAIAAGVHVNSVCGGRGTCGKCQVIVDGPHRSEVRGEIGDAAWRAGYRLACQTRPEGDLAVFVPEESQARAGKILSSHKEVPVGPLSPLVQCVVADMDAPSMGDNLADLERLKCALNMSSLDATLPVLRELPRVLRSSGWRVSAMVARMNGGRLIGVRSADRTCMDYGLAVDIGTTTVVAELVDLRTGRTVAHASDYNRQLVVGEDVLARIQYAEEKGVVRLQELVVDTINRLIGQICAVRDAHGVGEVCADDIVAFSVGGNTTMVHLFLGLDPKHIRYEPYIPIAHHPPNIAAHQLGLRSHPDAPVYCVPGRASYVGGDITADVMLSGLHDRDELSLLIDVGTNGEVVLGNKDWMVSCSTSAGPAFEGGEVSCGMRAMDGAIDSVLIKDYDIDLTTIGGSAPRGVCGSGLIDLVAQMFLTGHLDKKGHIQSARSERVRSSGRGMEFLVHAGKSDIAVTDDDIANIIRTKAAVYAGCAVLLESVDKSFDDVARIYIAGGFGSHINIPHAQLIGLLPDVPQERFEFLGNGSLGGAKLCLLSEERRQEAKKIYENMTYLDLSSSNEFFDQYSSALFLPHTDLERFPRVKERLYP